MSDKVLIRKEGRSKVFGVVGILLLVALFLMSVILECLGVFFLLVKFYLVFLSVLVICRLMFLIYYDLKFTNSTYEYVIFDSLKLVVFIPLLIYGCSCLFEFKNAEQRQSKFIVTDLKVYSYYLNNYNELVCRNPSEKDDEISFRFVFPIRNLDLFTNENLEGCELTLKYLKYRDRYFILEVLN